MPKRHARLKSVFTVIPANGTRRTATLWHVARLGGDLLWHEVTPEPVNYQRALYLESELRAEALRRKARDK